MRRGSPEKTGTSKYPGTISDGGQVDHRRDHECEDAAMTETAAIEGSDEAFPDGLADGLLELLNDELSLDPSIPIEQDTDLLVTGLIDSLGVIQIVSWIEDEVGVEVDPVDVTLENFQTAGRMIRFAASLA